MTAKVILNPYAGRWKASEQREEAEFALERSNIDFDIALTEHPGHGSELAYQAVLQGYSPIIAAGGDGSISEVMNGMVRAFRETGSSPAIPLGLLPLGSANDLVVNLNLPLSLDEAAKVIAEGHCRKMDICKVNSRYFDNNSAVGLEPTITLIQQNITKVRGIIRYLLAVIIGVMQNPQWIMRLEWDRGEYHGSVSLVTVGNNPLTGGLFYMAPHASPFDGLLTFVYGHMSTRFQILRMLPKTMKKGKGSYVEHPDIHEIHSAWLKIISESPTPLHADGEIQSPAISEINYTVLPAYLPVLINEADS
jgi:diacylglycerol kinase (ATP)